MAVLTKRAVCNYSAGSHLVSLQNKSVINEAAQNRCRNERRMCLHLTESSSHNRYCLIKIFPELVWWVLLPLLSLSMTSIQLLSYSNTLHSNHSLSSASSSSAQSTLMGQLYLQCSGTQSHQCRGHRGHGRHREALGNHSPTHEAAPGPEQQQEEQKAAHAGP